MTATAELTTEERKEEFIRLRREGKSLRTIGVIFDLSYERVRQVLGDDDPAREEGWLPEDERERSLLHAEIEAWLREHGPVARDVVKRAFGLSAKDLAWHVRNGLPDHLVLMPGRDVPDEFSQDDIVTAVQRAWDAARDIDPHAVGLSYSLYESLRAPSDPSASLIVSRVGWDATCEVAGVPAGSSNRPKSSYVSAWSDAEILAAVATWVDVAVARGVRATYNRYEEFQREEGNEHLPSGSTVRNRCRMMDPPLMVWPAIVAAARSAS